MTLAQLSAASLDMGLHSCRMTPEYWHTNGFVLGVTVASYIDADKCTLCRVVKLVD